MKAPPRRGPILAWLLTGFLLVAAAGGVSGLVQFRASRDAEARMATLLEDRVVPLRQLHQVWASFGQELPLHAADFVAGRTSREAALHGIATARAQAEGQWKAYKATYLVPDEERGVAALEALLGPWRARLDHVETLLRSGDSKAIEGYLTLGFARDFQPLTRELGFLIQVQERISRELLEQERTQGRRARLATLTLLTLALLGGAGFGTWLSLDLSKRLARLGRRMDEAAKGDLESLLPEEGRDEIGRLGGHLNAMIRRLRDQMEALRFSEQEAQVSNQAKSNFLAAVSHELRTPLNAILGFGQVLAEAPHLQPRDREHLASILRSGEHLLELINDLLTATRVEAGALALHPWPFATGPFFQGIHAILRPQAEARGLAFHWEIDPSLPPWIEGDADKLRRVLLNLLGNAVKFTDRGFAGLRVERRSDELLSFEIRDSGPGIPPEAQPQLFHAFRKGGSGNTGVEGVGLGLYLSQAMVRLMGGKIRLRSELGRGTSFSFILPLPAAQADPDAQPPEQAAETATPLQPSPEEVRALDPAFRAAFLEALADGDLEKATDLVGGLPPSAAPVANHLRRELRAYRVREMERWLTPGEEDPC